MKTRLGMAIGALVLVAAGVVAVQGPASAGQGTYGSNGVRIRDWPSSNVIHGLGYPSQGTYAYFGIDCTNLVISGNPWWDYNQNLTTGVTGYSADYYLTPSADTYYYTGTPC